MPAIPMQKCERTRHRGSAAEDIVSILPKNERATARHLFASHEQRRNTGDRQCRGLTSSELGITRE